MAAGRGALSRSALPFAAHRKGPPRGGPGAGAARTVAGYPAEPRPRGPVPGTPEQQVRKEHPRMKTDTPLPAPATSTGAQA